MNILQTILSGQNGAVVRQLAGQFGLDERQVESAVGRLVPALSRGVQNNTHRAGGLESLAKALQTGNHQRYIEQPDRLGEPETVRDGNAILGHIFGSKDVSRQVAGHAAQQTGIDSAILKQMLPVLASAVMGSLGQQSRTNASPLQGLLAQVTGGSSGESGDLAGILGNFLDADNDGSYLDDILGMLSKKAG